MEYPFIAIGPWSILAHCDSSWYGPIYEPFDI